MHGSSVDEGNIDEEEVQVVLEEDEEEEYPSG